MDLKPSLQEILLEARQMAKGELEEQQQPLVERNLAQVLEEANKLHWRLTDKAAGGSHERANELLSAGGVDLQKLKDLVSTLDVRNIIEHQDTKSNTDVASYLKDKREDIILAMIEENNANIFKAAERRMSRNKFPEWDQFKESLLSEWTESESDVTTLSLQQDKPECLKGIWRLFAQELMRYVQSQSPPFSLLSMFTQLMKNYCNMDPMYKMWHLLDYMARVPPELLKSVDITSRRTRTQFVEQGREYLEQAYKQSLENIIRSNIVPNKNGNIPNVYSKVHSLVQIKLRSLPQDCLLLDMAKNLPLWPHVFYCLRCGDLGAAIRYLKEWDNPCPNLLKLLQLRQEHKERKLHSNQKLLLGKLKTSLVFEYNSKWCSCSDPYKKAVFAVLLACDTQEPHTGVVSSIDDFLWMQLATDAQIGHEVLHKFISNKYGEKYFYPHDTQLLSFQILAFTGQFEAAVMALARNKANRLHAVHMALALNELCLLDTSSNPVLPLISNLPHHLFNMVRLITTFAKSFEKTDTVEAVHYYYLLRGFQTDCGHNMMVLCLTDLLVENWNDKNFNLIFGTSEECSTTVRFNGGIFDKLPRTQFDRSTLGSLLGKRLAERCNYDSAIKMYIMIGQLDEALSLASEQLTKVLNDVKPPKKELVKMLKAIIARVEQALNGSPNYCSACAVSTFRVLSKLLKFFDCYHKQQFRQASEILDQTKLIPISRYQVNESLSRLKVLGGEVLKLFPNVLLAAMDIFYQEYLRAKSGNSINNGRIALIQHLQARASALINLAATVPLCQLPDTNRRLIQMEIEMQL